MNDESGQPTRKVERTSGVDPAALYTVISNFDLNAGFTVLLKNAMNGIRNAIAERRIPVINFDKNSTYHFFDPELGENIWDYYFDAPMGVTFAELSEALDKGHVKRSQVRWITPQEAYYWHSQAPDRLASMWHDEDLPNREAWSLGRREEARRIVRRYIRVSQSIIEKVDRFWQEHISRSGGKPVYGVHIRGTDFGYADPSPPEVYFDAITRKAKQDNLSDFRIFVATDQAQFVELFAERFGKERVLFHNCIRSTGSVAPFKLKGVSHYRKGEDVLLDIISLSRCDFLFKCAASVGEAALWFSDTLACEDFGLRSNTDLRGYESHKRAYYKLDICRRGKWSTYLELKLAALEQFFECHVFAFEPTRSKSDTFLKLCLFIREYIRLKIRKDVRFTDNYHLWVNASPVVHNSFQGSPEGTLREGGCDLCEALASREIVNPQGLFWDGWARRRVRLRFRIRKAGSLTICGEIPQWSRLQGTGVSVGLKGGGTFRILLSAGSFEIVIPLAKSDDIIELKMDFDKDFQIATPDERVVAAHLKKLRLE